MKLQREWWAETLPKASRKRAKFPDSNGPMTGNVGKCGGFIPSMGWFIINILAYIYLVKPS